MTTIVSATRPHELLAYLPALAGFTPQHSLALVPFAGNRSCGVLRVDLPRGVTDRSEFVARLIGLVCQVRDADAVAIVVYDDAESDAGELPWSGLVRELIDRAIACGLGVVDALYVGPETWAAFTDAQGTRHPVGEILIPPTIPGIGDVSGDQFHGTALPVIDEEERELVARTLKASRGVLDDRLAGRPSRRTTPTARDVRARLDDLPAFFERILDAPTSPDTRDTVALSWCLNRPLTRDVALVQWARNKRQGAIALGAQIAYRDHVEPVPDSLGQILLGAGRRPDADRLGTALALARTVAARVPDTDRVGPFVASAWLSWALGRSTHADEYITRALTIDPRHSMASLIKTMLDAAILPGWAFKTRAETT